MSIISISNTIPNIINLPGQGGGGGTAFSSTKSLAFDGVDDIVYTNSTTIGVGGNCSLSFWVKGGPQLATSLGDYLFSADYYNQWTLTMAWGADLKWFNGNAVAHTLATDVFDDDWHHIVMIWNPSGADQTIRTYKDGSLATNVTTDYRYAQADTRYHGPLQYIGNRPTKVGFNGNIDEVAMWHTELSVSDIATIWGGGTPGDLTSLSPVGWWRMGENSTFKTPQILMPEQSNKDKVSNYSMEFDGLNDYVDCGNSTDLQITGALTVSSWVKFTSGNLDVIVTKDANGANRCWALWGDYLNVPAFNITSSNTHYIANGTVAIDDGDWHHVVGVFEPSTAVRIYVDGILDGENTTLIPATIDNDPVNVLIGGGVGMIPFPGKIDEVSIFNTAKAIGDLWDGTGKPTDLTGESGLVGYWKMGEEAVFNSTNWLLPNKAQDVFSRYSMEFDGLNDSVFVGNDSSLQPTAAITLSAWVNQKTAVWADRGIINALKYSYGGANGYTLDASVRPDGNLYFNFEITTSAGVQNVKFSYLVGSYNLNEWYHYMATFDGNTLTAYVNGAVIGTTSYTGAILYDATFYGVNINGKPYRLMHADVDEVSIFNSAKAIGDLWDGSGKPTDLTGQSGLVSWWRMGEDATYDATAYEWTIPDQAGSNDGTSANMTNDDLTGDAPGVSGNGTSANMTIEDRVGDAPDSNNNALSYNMVEADIIEEAP